ncbi:salicylate carboxymethyltransferase [Cocos nucifera]|uniref:Salicylate carboxymethyltransferase n=1 Tax=Cocos nucifera TaxID=13894 RepID=A0A8K0IB09_COCNU|nr:salicylate carboxymethyltransferase [Cocos nucifera]
MDVETLLHMKGGLGETSYARNSSIQKKFTDGVKHVVIDAAIDAYLSETPRCFRMADLGCSSGANALSLIGDIVNAIDERCNEKTRQVPQFMVFLNDLPGNDFNSVFISFSDFGSRLKNIRRRDEFHSVFMAAVPGSFYGRLFPSNSLHFIHSCHSLHWLSQVPPGIFNEEGKSMNSRKIYISKTSPPAIAKAYQQQFQKDFGSFLKSRSEELVSEGRMALIMSGRDAKEPCNKMTTLLWELLARSLSIMVAQGEIEGEDLELYNAPFYAPSLREIEDEVVREGSFTVEDLKIFKDKVGSGDAKKDGAALAMAIRAIQESMLCHHIGREAIDRLFHIYSELLSEVMQQEEIMAVYAIVVLRRSLRVRKH